MIIKGSNGILTEDSSEIGASGGFRTGPPPQPPPSAAPPEDQKISKQILNKKLKEHARQVMVSQWLLNRPVI